MQYLPHTKEEIAEMLEAIGAKSLDDLFKTIPPSSRLKGELDLPAASFDLLVSLYAGFVSEHCTDYLKIGGTLLVNPSHGDVAMASIDPRYELSGVVVSRDGDYRVRTEDLSTYLIPKSPVDVTPTTLHDRGRGFLHDGIRSLRHRAAECAQDDRSRVREGTGTEIGSGPLRR